MAKTSKRKIKKNLIDQIEEHFDLKHLDYAERTKPIRHKTKLTGAVVAFIVYGLGFGIGFYAWQNNTIAYENFAKLVWILMIPATVIGMFVWLLVTNRREYDVRQDVRNYIQQLEGQGGLLWRYAPILSELKPDELTIKEMITASQAGQLDKMAPEDYSQAVLNLYMLVRKSSSREISPETMVEFERNLTS